MINIDTNNIIANPLNELSIIRFALYYYNPYKKLILIPYIGYPISDKIRDVFDIIQERLWHFEVRFVREGNRAYKEGFDDDTQG